MNASSGQTVASAQSNQAGYYSTAVLPTGGYNVSASKLGYSFSTLPVSVWGDTEADFIEQSGAYPTWLVRSQNGLEPILPQNGQGWVSLMLYYPDGTPVPNAPVSATTGSGSMSPPTTTDSKGTATFTWYAGPQPGTYQITFYANVDSYNMTVSTPAGVLNIGLSSVNSSLSVPPWGSGSVQLNVNFLGPWDHLGRFATYPAQLSIVGLLAGATATFTPPQVNAVLPLLSAPSSLTINVSGSVPAGNYPLVVSAVDTGPTWFNVPMSASLPLTLNVGASSSSYGGITGVILNPDGNETSGSVVITQGTQTVYSTSTSNGYFNTGYILKPGSYTVTAYMAQNQNVYYAETVTVSASNMASVTLTPKGGLDVTVTHNGAPAAGANLSLVTPAGYTLKAVTNSQGQYSWGYSLQAGTYTIQVTYGGATSSNTVTLTSAEMMNLALTI
jgi:flagellar hook assembly protein FlgD